MTLPGGAPSMFGELGSVFVNVVPSMAGSQEVFRALAAEGATDFAKTFESVLVAQMPRAMQSVGAAMAQGLSAGLGASAGQAVLSHILPSESTVSSHMGRLGGVGARSYVDEFNRNYRQIVPVVEDVSAKAVAANKALVESTRAMGGTMAEGWYRSSKEATQAGDEMMAAWASRIKVGVGIAAAAAGFEFVRNVRKEFQAFEHVGEDAAQTLIGGFHAVLSGKIPDLVAPFNVLEEAAKTSLEAPLRVAETFVPALGLVRHAVEDLFGPFDKLKDLAVPVLQDIIQVGDQYLGLQRKLASSTLDPEAFERFGAVVRDIMASGAVVHFEDVADSIGRLNQNIQGLSTEQLKELTTTFAEAEELVGHIDETKFAGILNAWKIPAGQANDALTMLTNTARATGINFNELTGEMTKAGPAMRELGYDLEDTATFFAEMTQEGEKGTRLLFGMNDVVAKLDEQVQKGVFKNVQEGWHSVIEQVKAYHAAGDEAAAFNLLKQYMPANSATLMKDLIEQDIVSIDNAGVHIQGLHKDIAEAVEKSKDLGQTFEVIGQQIAAALAPTGTVLAIALREAGDHVTDWMKENQSRVAQFGADIAKGFLDVGTFVTVWFANILNAMAPLLDLAKDAVLAVTLPLSPIAHGMSAVFGGGWDTLASALDQANGRMMNFDFGKSIGEFDARANLFMQDTLPRIEARIQAPVDNLRTEEALRGKGFKMWWDTDDPTKVKVQGKTKDGKDVNDSSDLVPPGETSLTFVPQPGWNVVPQAPAPLPGFAFGGPTVQGDWRGKGDTIPAMLEVGEYVVNRAAAQKHRRELDAINFGQVGFDTGGDVGLEVLYGFLRGVAGGFGVDLPKEKDRERSSAQGWPTWPGFSLPAASSSQAPRGGSPQGPAGQDWLRSQLQANGLSPDEAKGILAMNVVEGGASDPKSLLGFTESQAKGPAAHVAAFMKQWNDPSRRGPGGSIPGVDSSGRVTDWNAYMTWIRVKIVGQTGVQSDWQGNAQPAPQDYQNRLMNALHFEHGGHVGDGGSWFGSTVHEHPGPNTANHFAHLHDGGPACAECGGAHPTGFCGGGVVHLAQGGDVGEAFSQVIWSNKETGQDIGENAGKWVGTPGSADPGFYHRGHNDFADHTGHVHTTVLRDPYTGAPYNQVKAGTNITAGSAGFPDWVYRLGRMYHVKPSTYPGHQEWQGINHGIDWWPDDATPNMTGQGYSHQDFATLTGFATAVGSMSAGQSQGAPQGAGPAGGTPGWQGFGVPIGAGGNLPGSPLPTDGSGGGGAPAPFNSSQGSQSYPLGPQGIIGPGYTPWNPPPGITPKQLQDWTPKYEHWQLDQQKKLDRLSDLQADVGNDWARQKQLSQQLTDDLAAFNKRVEEQLKNNPLFAGKTDQEVADALLQQGDPDAKKIAEEREKLESIDRTIRDKQHDITDAQLDQQAGNPPPQPGKEGREHGGPFESMSQQLGGGLVKGAFQALGLPDVFGRPFTSWGIFKLLAGGLGFGLNVANNWADRAIAGEGGPLAGLAPGGPGFPGTLPGQSGGPLGVPPGPPSAPPANDSATPPPSPAITPAPAKPAPKPDTPKPAPAAPPHQVGTPPPPGKHWVQDRDGQFVAVPDGQAGPTSGGPQIFSVPQPPQKFHTAAPAAKATWDAPPPGVGGGGQGYQNYAADDEYLNQQLGSMGGILSGDPGKAADGLISQLPSTLVGMQARFSNPGTSRGTPPSPNLLAGQMQSGGPNAGKVGGAGETRNINFTNVNQGVTSEKQMADVVAKQVTSQSRWWASAAPVVAMA